MVALSSLRQPVKCKVFAEVGRFSPMKYMKSHEQWLLYVRVVNGTSPIYGHFNGKDSLLKCLEMGDFDGHV